MIKEIFEKLDDDTVQKLDIDKLKKILSPLMVGLQIASPIIPTGTFLYRARVFTTDFNKERGIKIQDLIYPKKDKAILGRVNRDKQPMFYCSLSKEPIFWELPNLQAGNEIILSFWQTTEKMIVNNVGYTQKLFESLGATRSCPTWTTNSVGNQQTISINENTISDDSKKLAYSRDSNREIREVLSKAFMREVSNDKNYLYNITVAIAELHLGKIENLAFQFAGLLYPSVRAKGDGDNLALFPEFVDKNLILKKVVHIRIDNKEPKKVAMTCLDHANSFLENNTLRWLGRLPEWQGNGDAIGIATPGNDHEGDYIIGNDGNKLHWVIRDSAGNIIEPA